MEEDKILDTNLLIRGERGLTTALNIVEYPQGLSLASKVLWPERADFVTAITAMRALKKIGMPIAAVDLLLCAIAFNRDLTLVTTDRRIAPVKAVLPELKLEIVK